MWHLQDQRVAKFRSFFGHQNVIPNVSYVPSNLINKLNHLICHLILRAVFPITLSVPTSSLHTQCVYIIKKNSYRTSEEHDLQEGGKMQLV